MNATGSTVADVFEDGSVTIAALKVEFGIGRTTAYRLMDRGELPFSQVYGRRLIPRAAVKKLLASGLKADSAK